jgi:NAD(P)H-hydrate epimerase
VRSLVPVVTSSESAARDASAIAAGIPSRALMQRAGAASAAEIALRYRDRLSGGILVLAGPGNNGGDGWVVARALAAGGARVRVIEPVPSKTPDAAAERALALEILGSDAVTGAPASADAGEAIVVDALLGTGFTGAPRGSLASAIEHAATVRAMGGAGGATTVAIDVPSGLDASTGTVASEQGVIVADLTLTYGTLKRGQLVNRDVCGTVAVLDIGLGRHSSLDDGVPLLVDEPWVAGKLPAIPASAHKGIRKKLAIVGGAPGMAGASTLAARSALRSGIGMVKLVVASKSLAVVQESEPYALAAAWPRDGPGVARDIADWADAVVIGPGLGRGADSRRVLERVLRVWRGPTVLDADALTLFEKRETDLGALLGGRPALITPHPVEFARLTGRKANDVLAHRFEMGLETAATLGATVLLKGVPTVLSASNGDRLVSASGTPALATAGSGDVLSGIAGTMLAQLGDSFAAGAVAAWIHGRAAERVPSVGGGDSVRGVALEDVVQELRDAWSLDARPARYPVLAELPAIGRPR